MFDYSKFLIWGCSGVLSSPFVTRHFELRPEHLLEDRSVNFWHCFTWLEITNLTEKLINLKKINKFWVCYSYLQCLIYITKQNFVNGTFVLENILLKGKMYLKNSLLIEEAHFCCITLQHEHFDNATKKVLLIWQ